jgi:hypothetical protein
MLRLLTLPTRRHLVAGARCFSGEISTIGEAEQLHKKRWQETVTPWNARPNLVPAEENALTAKNTKGYVGQLAGIPADLLKRKARIYRRARQATSSSSDKTKAWKIEFNHQRMFRFFFSEGGGGGVNCLYIFFLLTFIDFISQFTILSNSSLYFIHRTMEQPSYGMAIWW